MQPAIIRASSESILPVRHFTFYSIFVQYFYKLYKSVIIRSEVSPMIPACFVLLYRFSLHFVVDCLDLR